MELKEFFHVNGGDGELSYSQNSSIQEEAWLMNQYMLENTLQSLFLEGLVLEGLTVADLGCGVGQVPFAFVKLVIKIVHKKCKELRWECDDRVPEIQFYMNDLPSNDFNFLFRNLLNLEALQMKDNKDGVPLCFLMGAPGSYYHMLFPRNSLHLVHSNYSLHWLSQSPATLNEHGVPVNKKNVYISETSPEIVAKAYLAQFEQDLTQFLKCRSQEVVSKGRMLLTLRGRPCSSNSLTWQPGELKIFAEALHCLVVEGLIKEEKVDSFNFPYYCASEEEIISIAEKERSFAIENTKTMTHQVAHEIEDKRERSKIISKFIRAFSETLIVRHFGQDIMDLLYDKIAYYAFQYLDHGQLDDIHTVTISLRKK